MAFLKSIPLIAYIVGGVILLIIILSLTQCGGDNTYQAQQTQQSTQAIADSANVAIETLEGSRITADNVKAAVEAAKGDIQDAQSVEAIQSVVTASLCQRPAYRDDPACK